jgi:hypothetical protein
MAPEPFGPVVAVPAPKEILPRAMSVSANLRSKVLSASVDQSLSAPGLRKTEQLDAAPLKTTAVLRISLDGLDSGCLA